MAFKQLVYITSLMLIFFVVYSQQDVLSNEDLQMDKRRADGHVRTSIPLFRGSNLGIFVRKRPFQVFPDHSLLQRKEVRTPSIEDEKILNENFHDNANNEQLQRRFDDYSDNPGPMFGR